MLAIAARSRSAVLAALSFLVVACVPDYEPRLADSGTSGVRTEGGTGGRTPADSSDRGSVGDSSADKSGGIDTSGRLDGTGGAGGGGTGGVGGSGGAAGAGGSAGTRDSSIDPVGPDGATHRLLVSDNGIALVSAPGLSKLSQAVTVTDSKGLPTEWEAIPDHAWLRCAPCSGRAGDSIVLTAVPTDLALDTVHYATVLLSSRDSTITRAEAIRIGLWVGRSQPQPSVSIPLPFVEVLADPIRPYAYTHSGGATISVYNVYTGQLEANYPQVAAKLGNMTVSSDGTKLFAVDAANRTVVPIQLGTSPAYHEVGTPWTLEAGELALAEYGRTEGVGMLFTGDGRVRSAETGGVLPSSFRAQDIIRVSQNGKRLCTLDTVSSPYTLECYPIHVDDGGNVVVGPGQGAERFQGFGKDIALKADGTRVYVAATGTETFRAYDWVVSPQLSTALLGAHVPNNVELLEDGRILAGADVSSGSKDIWIYDSLGAEKMSFRLGRPSARQLRVSGEGLRLIVITGESTSAQALQFHTLTNGGHDTGDPPDGGLSDGGGADSGMSDVATDTPDDSADGGAGCSSAPPVIAIGAFQKASCGSLDVTDVLPADDGVVYFVSIPLRRIVAWSAVTGACSNPILLKISPKYATYSSANHRLYVAYTDGAITSIDPDSQIEEPFEKTSDEPLGIAAAGKWIVASKIPGALQVFDPSGQEVDRRNNFQAGEFSWSAATGYMHFLGTFISTSTLHSAHIDCATGAIFGPAQSPYNGSYKVARPIRVSPDGHTALIGGGEVYDAVTLQRRTALPRTAKDATWLWNGKLLRLRTWDTGSVVEQRAGDDLHIENLQAFEGTPVALRAVGDGAVVVTVVANQPTFSIYHDNLDGDGDGVPYEQDAFPLDKAASIDTDHDGFPDEWNAAQDGGATPLSLDAFPQDSACYLASQARTDDATRCDITGTIPEYAPTSIVFDGTDVLYLLSHASQRVYRYSTVQAKHLNPFVLREGTLFIAYLGAPSGKLHLAREDGTIASIDLAGGLEADFAALPGPPRGLAGVGNFVLSSFYDDRVTSSGVQYIFGQDGSLMTEREAETYSREYAYSNVTSRVYFFRDGNYPNDILWAGIEQTTGAITGSGESRYHDDYVIQPPIRVSLDGGYVLLGSGDIYEGIKLEHQTALGITLLDAVWLPDNSLVALTADGNLRWFDNTFTPGAVRAVTGTPLRVFWSAGKIIAVTMVDGKPSFETIPL